MSPQPSLDQLRFNMIEQQIRPWDVLDPQVLDLLQVLRREEFVPPAHRGLAFVDMEVPLRRSPEEAVRFGQIMLAPKVEARLLQEVGPQPHEKVLEVGAGSGYMAALLAGRAQRVISLEIEPELAALARANLEKAGVRNAEVRVADGSQGLAAEGPFDVIVLSGSVAEVPPALLQQLKVGGRLATIVGEEPVMRATLITRTGDATFTTAQRWDTVAPRLLNFPAPSRFRF
ncbi:protein-L-isoaspartate O-methyltransferase family protein [Ramlibacter sp. Leaf400]|uniref:protein-L-isoaspartate O-methyltransferase family protein n=1 Tax=Ramlibacter sp. Leaf400 TaxID=1736365 RepID=UPI0006FC3825|nr:protein-L-isoaspartate O-methyltransferase [Ramlibacter sp. Leaf400]KQT13532.1 protein-L-isoaspartate O-methyltransferase [Ramlibacter sp. Leaf400]